MHQLSLTKGIFLYNVGDNCDVTDIIILIYCCLPLICWLYLNKLDKDANCIFPQDMWNFTRISWRSLSVHSFPWWVFSATSPLTTLESNCSSNSQDTVWITADICWTSCS